MYVLALTSNRFELASVAVIRLVVIPEPCTLTKLGMTMGFDSENVPAPTLISHGALTVGVWEVT
jgi:hypothetical protein